MLLTEKGEPVSTFTGGPFGVLPFCHIKDFQEKTVTRKNFIKGGCKFEVDKDFSRERIVLKVKRRECIAINKREVSLLPQRECLGCFGKGKLNR